MKRLERLPEDVNEMLGGLHASEELKEEILRSGAALRNGEKVSPRCTPWAAKTSLKQRRSLVRAAALVCTAAFVLGLLVGVPMLIDQPSAAPGTLITTQTAGSENLPGDGNATALDIPKGSIIISQRDKPAYRGIWEAASGANFPLICANGRYYRMLINPTEIGNDLLGSALGTVETYTSEPSLATGGIISNVAAQGETVYAVRNMNGAMVAARVNGVMRVFQRVSYGSSALRSGEDLGATLCADSVVAMELTGVGTVTDEGKAQELYHTLLMNATLARSGASETGSSLLLQLKNGLVLQLAVRDESVMACGTWTCPEFFEAFAEAVK